MLDAEPVENLTVARRTWVRNRRIGFNFRAFNLSVRRFMELLRDLYRSGATICMVTRVPRYASYAGRTVRLFDGRVVEEQEFGARGSARGSSVPCHVPTR